MTIIFKGMEPARPSIIMVAGVGGGGSNAVNHMFDLGITDVTFIVCNTDRQALNRSQVPIKVMLGEGLGAGNRPERARAAALNHIGDITSVFEREGTRMVFITAGMGGGTGTGAAPVIAKAAKDMGILTVGIVTLPFKAEGPLRTRQAQEGIEQLRGVVDSLLIINNESIQEIYGKLPLTEAFGKADDILATAAKGIAEIITRDGIINVDFADVRTVMSDSGISLMGSGRAGGADRAQRAADLALNSPLLNHNNIVGARNVLLSITSGRDEVTLEEAYWIAEYIQERAGNRADMIWGAGSNLALEDEIEVTIIATGFDLEVADLLNPGTAPARGGVQRGVQWGTMAAAGNAVPPIPEDDKKVGPEPASNGQDKLPEREVVKVQERQFEDKVKEVLVSNRPEAYSDLDDILSTPAYLRRKVEFTKPAGPKPGTKKEESSDPQTGSLF